MATVLNIPERASLALHAMGRLAVHDDRPQTNMEMAEAMGVSSTHLSKVLQRLHQAGLVTSTPGPGGGFSLARSSDEITLLDVYEVLVGPLRPTRCLLNRPTCDGACILGDLLVRVHNEVTEYLGGTRLSDLARSGAGTTSDEKKDRTHRRAKV